jgi:Kef-type K+ transport system membrane component KefB
MPGSESIAQVFLALAVILAAAKLGGDLAIRLRQPAVLGELLAGVVLGNVGLTHWHALEFIKTDPNVRLLAEIGVVLLLYEAGLASTVRDMLKVGPSALLAAHLGVVASIGLGTVAAALLLPERSHLLHLFLGAALAPTSVGIAARVLADLRRSDTPEARVILGTSIIDDVLGLIVLALVSGLVGARVGTPLGAGFVLAIIGKAAGFLFGAIVIGGVLGSRILWLAVRLRGTGLVIAGGLVTCFLFAYLATLAGLSPIIGAFAAGLVFEPAYQEELGREQEAQALEHLLAPLTAFLVPVFFVLMGCRVDLRVFAHLQPLVLSVVLSLAAILGKQACALGVIGRGLDRLSVGMGMIPRGEVSLIFASVGLGLQLDGQPLITPAMYTAIVLTVIITTLVTPPALRWSVSRGAHPGREAGSSA